MNKMCIYQGMVVGMCCLILTSCGGKKKAGTVQLPSETEETSVSEAIREEETVGNGFSKIDSKKESRETAGNETENPLSDPWASPYENTEYSVTAYLGSCKEYDWRSLMRQSKKNIGVLTKKTISVQRIDGNEIYGWTAVYDWKLGGYQEFPDELWCVLDNREDKSLSVLNGDYITAYGTFDSDGNYAAINAKYIKFTNPSEEDPFFKVPELSGELEQCVIYIAPDSYKKREGETTVEVYSTSLAASFGVAPKGYLKPGDKVLAPVSRKSGYIEIWQYGEFVGYVDNYYIGSGTEDNQVKSDISTEEYMGNAKADEFYEEDQGSDNSAVQEKSLVSIEQGSSETEIMESNGGSSIPIVADIFGKDEEIWSWNSDISDYYLIPFMEDNTYQIWFTTANDTEWFDAVYTVEIDDMEETSSGGVVCRGDMFQTSKENPMYNGRVEVTWNSMESIDYCTVKIIDGDQFTDMSVVADDYAYYGMANDNLE